MMEPYKSQPVLYRAIAGDEYAAVVTDVRELGCTMMCSLTAFMPESNATVHYRRIEYFERKSDAAEHEGPACYPAI